MPINREKAAIAISTMPKNASKVFSEQIMHFSVWIKFSIINGKTDSVISLFPHMQKRIYCVILSLGNKVKRFYVCKSSMKLHFFSSVFFSNKVRISLQVKSGRNKFAEKKRRILQKTEVRVTVGDLIYVGQDGKLHLGIVYLRVYAFFGHGEFNWFVFS